MGRAAGGRGGSSRRAKLQRVGGATRLGGLVLSPGILWGPQVFLAGSSREALPAH